ncbi:MAG: colanic acid/amylovoran biosynthesis glycosyltransferase [Hyphomicrobiaceae bacterium]
MRTIAYLFPLFPVINQTFTLREVVWLKEQGYDVRIISLLSRVQEQQQPEARALMEDTHYCPRFFTWELWGPTLRAFFKTPFGVLKLFAKVLSAFREKAPRPGGPAPGPATFSFSEWIDVLYRGTAWFYLVKSLTMVPYAIYLSEYVKREGIAHVHCQWATYPATVGMLAKQWSGVTYSIAAHAYDIYLVPRMLTSKIENAEFVVTCADFNRQNLAAQCSPAAAEHIHLNYHGTDMNRFHPGEHVPAARRIVTSVGWLKEYKGFHVVLDAIGLLVERGYDIELHLAGDGPQRGWLERRAAELGIADRLVLHGFVDHPTLSDLYRRTEVFAMGSIEMSNFGRQDVIPNVLAEAMASGVPIVATRMGGIPELVEDQVDGLLVEQRDPEAMAAGLAEVLDAPAEAAARATTAREKVHRIWDRNLNLRQLVTVFERYIGSDGKEAA